MSDDDSNKDSLGMGVFGRSSRLSGLTAAEMIALALSALWLMGVTVFFFVTGAREAGAASDPLRGLTVIFAVFMPIALIWVATIAANSARAMRSETRRLQQALDAMRAAYVAQNQAAGAAKPSVEKKLDQIFAAQKEAGAALATFTSTRPGPSGTPLVGPPPESGPPTPFGRKRGNPEPGAGAAPPSGTDTGQPSLALPGDAAAPAPVTIEDFIRAMNFPRTAEDKEGFRALKRAMGDRRTGGLLQASQDILTLLSQDGIYMDDMRPDPARPELWRRFAQGERGRAIAALGGIRDRSGIALAAGRMRKDHIYRDTAHHFLRRFDKVFAEFEKSATDAEIVAFADTRTARAFMLLGRVAGTFD